MKTSTPKRRAKQRWPFIKKRTYPNGTIAWQVDARTKQGGERKAFETLVAAETFAEQCRVRRGNEGLASFTITEDLRIEAGKCMELLAPYGKSLTDAVDYFLPFLKRTASPKLLTVLVDEAIAEKKERKLEKPTIAEFKCRCKLLTEAFPGRNCGTITAEEISTWLATFEHPVTRDNCRKAAVNLFNFAVRKKLLPTNPAIDTHRMQSKKDKKRKRGKAEILTPAQIAALLLNSNEEILPYFAIAAFAGVRPQELQKLDWSDFYWKQGVIQIRDEVSNKTGPRTITIAPNLAEWLKPYHKHTGLVRTPPWRRYFRETRIAAGITRWPDDCLRHSFATYWLEISQDAAALALQMGNSVDVILDHYRQILREPDDAVQFWTMAPGKTGQTPPAPQDPL